MQSALRFRREEKKKALPERAGREEQRLQRKRARKKNLTQRHRVRREEGKRREGMSKEEELLKDEYLWDGSGEVDAEVVRLERAPELPANFEAARQSQENLGTARLWFQFAVVAASAMVVFSLWMGLRVHSESIAGGSEWRVEQVAGAPRVGTKAISGAREKGRLR